MTYLAMIANELDERAVSVDRLAQESDGTIQDQQRSIAEAYRQAAKRTRLTDDEMKIFELFKVHGLIGLADRIAEAKK